jgi:hypothetical protein
MKPAFRDAAIRSVRAILLPRLKDYREVEPFHPTVLVMFKRSTESGLSFFTLILAPEDREEFTVEAGWSRDGGYPRTVRIKNPTNRPEALTQSAFRLRVDRLWGTRRDYWWRLEPPLSAEAMLLRMEEALAVSRGQSTEESTGVLDERSEENVQGLVTDAADRVQRYLLPFFAEVERSQKT